MSLSREPLADGAAVLSAGLEQRLFGSELELVPQLNEVYELELAYLESELLDNDELVRNGAYFARVGDTLTRHFLMCSGEPVRLPQHSSSRLRSFFKTNQFKTGYASHGLFPYRGKFHPQMIKALLNVMGLKQGDTVLDPMMGSGTVLIEATLMGIRSIGVDASPFCRFMAQAKVDALTVPLGPVQRAAESPELIFECFNSLAGRPQNPNVNGNSAATPDLFSLLATATPNQSDAAAIGSLPAGCEVPGVYDFLLLAYLDSVGYSERSRRKTPYEQFSAILERYFFVAQKIQAVLAGIESELAEARAFEGDARTLQLESNSVDGIIFSPPYSFAIDYLENDAFHLGFLGIDSDALREKMVGLRGRTLSQKFKLYKADMDAVLTECGRVLRPEGFCTIIVGTNNNQLSKILNVAPAEVEGIDQLLVEMATTHGLQLAKRMSRQITGMANTMRTEYILMLQRR